MPSKVTVEAAEAALHELEKHNKQADISRSLHLRALRRAEEDKDSDPESAKEHLAKAAVHKTAWDEAEKAHKDSGVTDRHIDIAAQVVLDARGEGHTETNILPSGMSIDDFNAAKAKAEAV